MDGLCCKSGCARPGRWQPVLLLYAPKSYGNCSPIQSVLGLRVCDACRDEAQVRDFVGDEGWAQIRHALRNAGKVIPDRDRTQLAWQEHRDLVEEAIDTARVVRSLASPPVVH